MRLGYKFLLLQATIGFGFMNVSEAGSIRLSPVKIELLDTEKASSLTLYNQSSESSNYQIRAFKWTQNQGEDMLQETDEIAVSPPILNLKPDVSFTIRIVRTKPSSLVDESAYRILIDELPKPVDQRKAGQGVNIIMRSSVPMFVTNKDAIPQLSIEFDPSSKSEIWIRNSGKRYAYLSSLNIKNLTTDQEISIPVNTINGYILSGQAKKYKIQNDTWLNNPAHQYSVKATVNGTTMEF